MALFEIIENALKAAKLATEGAGTTAGKAYLHYFLGGGRPMELALTDAEQEVLQRAVANPYRASVGAQINKPLLEMGQPPFNPSNYNAMEKGDLGRPTRIGFSYGAYDSSYGADAPLQQVISDPATSIENTFGKAYADVGKTTKVYDLYKFYDPSPGTDAVKTGQLLYDTVQAALENRSLTPYLTTLAKRYGKPYVIHAEIPTTPMMALNAGKLNLGMENRRQLTGERLSSYIPNY